jgi:hypothetical protein
VISRRELVRTLSRHNRIADWIVIERAQEIAIVDELRSITRRELRTELTVVIHTDTALGRGSAQVVIHGTEGDPGLIVNQGLSIASAAIGPAWKSVPPAAPANVDVEDVSLAKTDLVEIARSLVQAASAARRDGATVRARGSMMRERVAVQARSGFHDNWTANEVRVDALVGVGERSAELTREARIPGDLVEPTDEKSRAKKRQRDKERIVPEPLEVALANAVADLRSLETAGAPPQNKQDQLFDIVLSIDALLHGDGLGVWSAFAAQADATRERQGLTRYRPNAPIVPGAAQMAEPLSISSDGAIPYALRSAPVGEEGDAIRRFALVDRGTCVGLALSMREAALRGKDPNGGIRNLVVGKGTWPGDLQRTIEIRRLRALSIDRYTGDASLEIALGIDHSTGTPRPFTGGTVRLDLISALARARRRNTLIQRGAYVGPPAVLIERAELLA